MRAVIIEVVVRDGDRNRKQTLLTKEYDETPTPTTLYNELVAALKVRLLGK